MTQIVQAISKKTKQIPWNKGIKTGIIPPNAFKKGHVISEETRKKLSESKKGMKYKKMSDIGRINISEAHKGIRLSKEHRRNISIGNKGKKRTLEMKEKYSKAKKGIVLSKETRLKISKAKKGIRNSIKTEFKKGHKNKHSEETKQKIRLTLTGRHRSDKTRKKLRLATIKYVNEKCNGCFVPMIGRNENAILDELQEEYGYNILRQYQVEGYFLDGYIPELKLAIEVDEKPKDKERDKRRQKEIEDKLKCKFLRIKDYN